MKLIESNILIYAPKPEYTHLKDILKQDDVAVSEISRLEVLGYHKITEEQKRFFNAVFSLTKLIPIDTAVIDKAITMRQTKNVKVGDAIIAATASLIKCELLTRNTDDFKHITEITLTNPIDK